MNKIYLFLLIPLILVGAGVSAQNARLQRSVISSFATQATTHPNGLAKFSSTFGQPPNAGTDFSGDNYLRQGFEQPVPPHGGIGSEDGCAGGIVSFAFEALPTQCGTYYNFEYTGTIIEEGYEYLWDFGVDGVPSASTEANPLNVSFISAGVHNVTLTVVRDTCSTNASKLLTVLDPGFGVQMEVESIPCFGESLGSIRFAGGNGNTPYSYQWSNGSTEQDQVDLEPGDYTFTVTDNIGCEYVTPYLTVESPAAAFTAVTFITPEACEETLDGEIELLLSGGTVPYSILWSDGATTDTLTGLGKGDYALTITDGQGCIIDTSFTVFRLCEDGGDLFIFDTFTPNEDGVNDTWVIQGIENYPDNEVLIYSRWGSVVYKESGYTNGWNGTSSSGKKLPSSAYWYILRLNDKDNNIFAGSVTIIR